MRARDLVRTLTPLGWLALVGMAVVLLAIAGRGLGLRWDPFGLQQRRMEAAEARATQVGALKRSLRLARLRYDNGYSSYLEVLDAERGLFQAELDAIDAQRQRLSATVELYKALGGGWQADKADKS